MANDRFGINVHLPEDRINAFGLCNQLGVAWIRIDIDWKDIEKSSGHFNWSNVDRVVTQATGKGLKIFATLAYTPKWASGSGDQGSLPTNNADWTNFVSTAVRRYSDRINHWGVWNEPNLPQFFKGSMADYVDKILIPGAESIRATSPNAQVLGPDLSDMGEVKITKPDHWSQWMAYIFEREKEYIKRTGKPLVDIVTHHIYKPTSSTGKKKNWWTVIFNSTVKSNTIFTMLDGNPLNLGSFWGYGPSLKNHMQACGISDRPLWLTEVGWNSAKITEKGQEKSYSEFTNWVRGRQWIGKVFFYELKDDPNRPDGACEGLIDSNLRKKPAFAVLQSACNK